LSCWASAVRVAAVTEQKIRFDDGAAYERMMGKWSRLAGDIFLDWLGPEPGQRWIDVGCGNGAFTELVVERCAPVEIDGIDPSEGQLAFARKRHTAQVARFHQGDAMALPFEASRCDLAVMALVIFFIPDPVKGVAEMVRVVRPGGTVATYAWDVPGGGLPFESIFSEMQAMGLSPPKPPRADASSLKALRDLWTGAGLEQVEAREINVTRSFSDFDDFWTTSLLGTTGQVIAALPAAEAEELKARTMKHLLADRSGRITYGARANAVKGRVPG
jgi:ubiquinone/menaquinone biosynthesis C-methylase UbiE